MREVLASLPGFSLKSSRRRSTKRLSAAAQLEAGLVDLESPASILSSTSLRALLNRHTFQGLPPLYQKKLAQLLPGVDRQDAATSGLNNEFFARACLEWRKRLAEGEFTPENQQRLKMEAEKDKNKLDPWKLKHFEPIWGDKKEPKQKQQQQQRYNNNVHCINQEPRITGGAVTRSSFRLGLETNNQDTQAINDLYCRNVLETPNNKTETINCPIKNSAINETCTTKPINTDNKISNQCKNTTTLEINETIDNRLNDKDNHISIDVITNSNNNINTDTKNKHENKFINNDIELSGNKINDIDDIQMDIIHDSDLIEVNKNSKRDHETVTNNIIINQVQLNEKNSLNIEPATPLNETIIISTIEDTINSDTDEVNNEKINNDNEQNDNESVKCYSQDNNLIVNLSQVSDIEISRDTSDDNCEQQFDALDNNEKIYESAKCKSDSVFENIQSHENVIAADIVLENNVINVPINNTTTDTEPIPEAMEIDSETLQRIHELEVRGEMREAYEEISSCTEEVIYPLLEGMEMGSTGSDENETQIDQTKDIQDIQETNINEDEELRDANNYVCSEMLECSWPVDNTNNNNNPPAVNNITV